jgi:hypothetical protein
MMPRDLLNTVEQLRDNGHWGSAVVFAQTACELCTELVITYGFHRLLSPASPERPFRCKLGEKVGNLFTSYNLGNQKLRGVYEALTGNAIQECSFWVRYLELTALRNRIVHRGMQATEEQARQARDTAGEFLRHMETVWEQLQSDMEQGLRPHDGLLGPQLVGPAALREDDLRRGEDHREPELGNRLSRPGEHSRGPEEAAG